MPGRMSGRIVVLQPLHHPLVLYVLVVLDGAIGLVASPHIKRLGAALGMQVNLGSAGIGRQLLSLCQNARARSPASMLGQHRKAPEHPTAPDSLQSRLCKMQGRDC